MKRTRKDLEAQIVTLNELLGGEAKSISLKY